MGDVSSTRDVARVLIEHSFKHQIGGGAHPLVRAHRGRGLPRSRCGIFRAVHDQAAKQNAVHHMDESLCPDAGTADSSQLECKLERCIL